MTRLAVIAAPEARRHRPRDRRRGARATIRPHVGQLSLLLCAACTEAPDQRLAIVDAPRILAIIAEPAEARPPAEVTYAALVAGPEGTIATDLAWAQCLSPKPPTEDNAVSAACLTPSGVFVDLGAAASVRAALPFDACDLHGPGISGTEFRPRDADASGGYYQPVRADLPDGTLVSFGLSRITCKLPTAPFDVAIRYDREYVANRNPVFAATSPAQASVVAAGSDVELAVSWTDADVEPYLYFDTLAQDLVVRREAMRVSWFATGGEIDVDASAVPEGDERRSVATRWRAPAERGPATLWYVLRDSRGGLATATIDVTVE